MLDPGVALVPIPDVRRFPEVRLELVWAGAAVVDIHVHCPAARLPARPEPARRGVDRGLAYRTPSE